MEVSVVDDSTEHANAITTNFIHLVEGIERSCWKRIWKRGLGVQEEVSEGCYRVW